MGTQIDDKQFLEVYKKFYSSLVKKDFETFSELVYSPQGQEMTREDWSEETISNFLQMCPNPKDLLFLRLISKSTDFGYQFLNLAPAEPVLKTFDKNDPFLDHVHMYGMIFFVSSKGKFKVARVLSKPIGGMMKVPLADNGRLTLTEMLKGKRDKSLEEMILSGLDKDSDFALNQQPNPKKQMIEPPTYEEKIPEKQKAKTSNELVLKNNYDGIGDISVKITNPPKNWFDLQLDSGNPMDGNFEFLIIGGIGYSESDKVDYDAKRVIRFQFVRGDTQVYGSKSPAISDLIDNLKSNEYSVTDQTETGFVAFKKETLDYGERVTKTKQRYRMIKKAKTGFLEFCIDSDDPADFSETKKVLDLIVSKTTLEV